VDNQKASFLIGEFQRARSEYARTNAQTIADAVSAELTGDLNRVNEAIASFMNSTAEAESYDQELGYRLALDGSGDPDFSAIHIPETLVTQDQRAELERAVREGQMDSVAAMLRINQVNKLRAILGRLSETINN
jgi:hypothetical protein